MLLPAKGSFLILIITLHCTWLTRVHSTELTESDDSVTVTNALDESATVAATAGRQYPQFAGCPLCDASVYGYCSYKMLHDSCCCDFPVMQLKPPQCWNYDCTLLYAKSCYEHSLIKNCCCNSPY